MKDVRERNLNSAKLLEGCADVSDVRRTSGCDGSLEVERGMFD